MLSVRACEPSCSKPGCPRVAEEDLWKGSSLFLLSGVGLTCLGAVVCREAIRGAVVANEGAQIGRVAARVAALRICCLAILCLVCYLLLYHYTEV